MIERAEEVLHLDEVKLRIAEGDGLVAEQEQRLEDLRKDGHPTYNAEKTLESLKGAVQALRETQAIIERTLREMEAGKLP